MFDQNAPIQVGNRPEPSRPSASGSYAAAEKTGPIATEQNPHGFPTQMTPGMHPGMHSAPQTSAQAQFRRAAQADEQNLSMGFLFGLTAALAGAGVWAVITALSGWQIGFMAIGVGFLVGYAVRLGGKGVDQIFAVLGAGLALFGCLMGNLFTSCWFIAQQFETSISEVLFSLNGGAISEIFVNTFSPIDLIFYAIAIHTGYKFSRIEDDKPVVKPKK